MALWTARSFSLAELKVRVKQPVVEPSGEDEGFQAVAGEPGEDTGGVARKRRLMALAKGEGRER
jgi:hypothetical protein